jgi:hypothetical protein
MKKYILLIAISIISLASVNWVSAQTATNEWDACKGSTFRNGSECRYMKDQKTETGYCDRAGGASGSQLYCDIEKKNGKIVGWQDCFPDSKEGDACVDKNTGEYGSCQKEQSASGNTSTFKCNNKIQPDYNAGGYTPATCGGKRCNSATQFCVEIDGAKTCADNGTGPDGKCGGKDCKNPKVCVKTQDGAASCLDRASTPGIKPSDNSNGSTAASSPQTVSFPNPSRFTSITELIAGIINALLGILGAITVAVLVASGFKYMTSSNPVEVGQALEGIKNSIVGLMIIMGAFLITQYVITALAG